MARPQLEWIHLWPEAEVEEYGEGEVIAELEEGTWARVKVMEKISHLRVRFNVTIAKDMVIIINLIIDSKRERPTL